MRALLLLPLLAVGCLDWSGYYDGEDDAAVAEDLAVAVDAATPPDATPRDRAAPDRAEPPDLTPEPDLLLEPDLVPGPDLALPPGIELVTVAAASFQMGSPDTDLDASSDEKPQHKVTISRAYEIQATEVTQRQWYALMGTIPSNGKGDDLPVERVNWYATLAYCNALSTRKGLEPCYFKDATGTKPYDLAAALAATPVFWPKGIDCQGYRLPTEAEWECACRAGGTAVRYGDPDQIAWYMPNGSTMSHEVKGRTANDLGLYDLFGNVWEWVWDYHDGYPSTDVKDPVGPAVGASRVIRGGSYNSMTTTLRAANRGKDPPASTYRDVGFRIARTLP